MRRWTLPVVLGGLTCLLIVALLWRPEAPRRAVVVAATDLGAGVSLTAPDLTTVSLPDDQAPADAVADASALVGQTLAVVRFAGEPITPKHLGPAVDLRPDERGVAVKVRADTGLAGLLRPGMAVGVVATLHVSPPSDQSQAGLYMQGNAVYAKLLLENLRVVYVSPDFQARPDVPVTLRATVTAGNLGGASQGGLFAGGSPQGSTSSAEPAQAPKEGVLVLAAGTRPVQVVYVPPTDAAMAVFGGVPMTTTVKSKTPTGEATPDLRWVVPAEMLSALNAADALSLVLMPASATKAGTPGILVSDLVVDNQPRGGTR